MSYTHLFIAVFLLHQAVGQEKISGTGEFSKQQYLQNEIQESPSEENVPNVVCPGGEVQCPTGNTCCRLASGEYGCCPLPNAVCCSDRVHCCPQGTTCTASGCTRGAEIVNIYTKSPASKVPNVVCPGGEVQCPAGNTCCRISSGGYACCPLPDAVCCPDDVHCCPQGYTCTATACIQGAEIVKIYTKIPATKVPNVICPGGEQQCPTGQTCCPLSSHEYGCCPLPKAVCCSDHKHCCPKGTTCIAGICFRGAEIVKIYSKITATKQKVPNIVCPDGSECPMGDTCCQLSSGRYGCCPFPQAVCCSDHDHCCPEGTTCDVASGSCNRGTERVKIYTQISATKVPNLVCPDGSLCPDSGFTCCQLSSGGYGCCPFPHAVCCSDHEHCCPEGTTCDVASGSCNGGTERVKIYTKISATKGTSRIDAFLGNAVPAR